MTILISCAFVSSGLSSTPSEKSNDGGNMLNNRTIPLEDYEMEMRRQSQVANDLAAMQARAALGIPEPNQKLVTWTHSVDGRKVTIPPAWADAMRQDSQPKIATAVTIDCTAPLPDRRVCGHEVLKATCKYFNIPKKDLIGARRARHLARARQIGMFLTLHFTGLSLPQTGKLFGDRDHTTVLHAKRKIAALIHDDDAVREDVYLIANKIREGEFHV